MPHGRELRLFLADGTSSGPRFYQIENRTIQALAIPATRIKDLISEEWPEFQKPGVYLVHGITENGSDLLYVGKGGNVGKRVQRHPEKLEFEVTSLFLFSSKDNNLDDSKVGWLESKLIGAAVAAKKVALANVQNPELPPLDRVALAIASEFYEDLVLIAQTGGYDFFSLPKTVAVSVVAPAIRLPSSGTAGSPSFVLHQPAKKITAYGYLSDDGFVVKAGSDASASPNRGLHPGYAALREKLIQQKVLIANPTDLTKLQFTIDCPFSAPSPAAVVVVGNNMSGPKNWKTEGGQTLAEYLESAIAQSAENANPAAT